MASWCLPGLEFPYLWLTWLKRLSIGCGCGYG
jgi:hypothetical protein